MNCTHYKGRDTAAMTGTSQDSARSVGRVGIIGANAMGIGIAISMLDADVPVTLFDVERDALDSGISLARSAYGNAVTTGELSPDQRDRCMALLAGTVNFHHLKDCDLIIDATTTDRASKVALFRRLDQVARLGAVLMTDVSNVSVDHIAGYTRRHGEVLGLRVARTATSGGTWKIVPGKDTSSATLGIVNALARQLREIAVVCGICHSVPATTPA
jgi:3-hydroxyacyl-CoA dehydrogenase